MELREQLRAFFREEQGVGVIELVLVYAGYQTGG